MNGNAMMGLGLQRGLRQQPFGASPLLRAFQGGIPPEVAQQRQAQQQQQQAMAGGAFPQGTDLAGMAQQQAARQMALKQMMQQRMMNPPPPQFRAPTPSQGGLV